MANVPKPLRMPIQLMCGKCQRAQGASANRMCARSRDADGPSVRHTNSKAARLWTQSTEGLLYLYRTARRLRNPRPVLAPYRNIIQYFPWNRGCEQACRGSRAPYQQISPCNLHCSPFTDDIPCNQLLHCAAGDTFRSRSSSCLHVERAANATSNVPKCRGCTR